MPPRRRHRKSRGGCVKCKARKVKCDETKPTRGACARNPDECIYPDTLFRARSQWRQVGAPEPSQESDSSNFKSPYPETSIKEFDPERRRALELLLLHYFTTYTGPRFPSFDAPDLARKWQTGITHLALEHDFLLHTIFAITALHQVIEPFQGENSSAPRHNFDFAHVHRVYLDLAVPALREALAKLDGTNAAALCWAAMVMTYIAMCLLPEEDPEAPPTGPVQWLTIAGAVVHMWRATMPWCEGQDPIEFVARTKGPDFLNDAVMYDWTYGEPFRGLIDFNDGHEIMDAFTTGVYNKVLGVYEPDSSSDS